MPPPTSGNETWQFFTSTVFRSRISRRGHGNEDTIPKGPSVRRSRTEMVVQRMVTSAEARPSKLTWLWMAHDRFHDLLYKLKKYYSLPEGIRNQEKWDRLRKHWGLTGKTVAFMGKNCDVTSQTHRFPTVSTVR